MMQKLGVRSFSEEFDYVALAELISNILKVAVMRKHTRKQKNRACFVCCQQNCIFLQDMFFIPERTIQLID
jgi:hypothetical protein